MPIKFSPFSQKQRQIFSWWTETSPVKDYNGIIADGSIRAGKTFPMALSFVFWAFENFEDQQFGLCGKTVGALRRNVLVWLLPILREQKYLVHERRLENLIIISKNGKTNYFYLFGGKDEKSQDFVQGITLAGVYFDEVALMPQSFVNQATGRCSVEGAKYWFNCNPESPSHWFKDKWLDECAKKRLVHLHFTMDDNPSLSVETKERYQRMWSKGSVFYKRFIQGLWVMAEGAIYDMITDDNYYVDGEGPNKFEIDRASHYISIDYGTQNATCFLYIIDTGTHAWVEDEYYYSGKTSYKQKTNSEYAADLKAFIGDRRVTKVIIDPSAASFKAELRNNNIIARVAEHSIEDAENCVLEGIRVTASLLSQRIIKINKDRCPNLVRELLSYVWDPKPTEKGNEKPLKKDDHSADALRYFCRTIFTRARMLRMGLRI